MAKNKSRPRLSKKLREIVEKVNQAVRAAIMDHKRAGNSIAVWRDGRSVIAPPRQIPDLD